VYRLLSCIAEPFIALPSLPLCSEQKTPRAGLAARPPVVWTWKPRARDAVGVQTDRGLVDRRVSADAQTARLEQEIAAKNRAVAELQDQLAVAKAKDEQKSTTIRALLFSLNRERRIAPGEEQPLHVQLDEQRLDIASTVCVCVYRALFVCSPAFLARVLLKSGMRTKMFCVCMGLRVWVRRAKHSSRGAETTSRSQRHAIESDVRNLRRSSAGQPRKTQSHAATA
jgi:hypothetical protein